jgi:hypothetical protein
VLLVGKATGYCDFRDASIGFAQAAFGLLHPTLHQILMRGLADARTELAGEMAGAQAGSVGNRQQADRLVEVGLHEIDSLTEPAFSHGRRVVTAVRAG